MSATAETELAGIGEQITSLAPLLASFDAELARLRENTSFTSREMTGLASGFSAALRRSFDGLLFDGLKLDQALKGLTARVIDNLYAMAMRPVHKAAGGALAAGIGGLMSGLMPFAAGAPFSQGRVMPFARGGIVTAPTRFAMRGADGRLGVATTGQARPVSLVMNITTPDAESFRRSESQIAAQIGRALMRGQRNR
ncbi:phage tail tape measure protein [Pseudogemmobacter faecipullorum]|uniref:Phage tail tape measure protein n=1 Tax=Pseudogemmobacter faecipullorum TaxID=2755041 RepID=A0ABS8CKT6_9RHOB|nr:phage tail tape measure protein [Pseudogemmobacter faecipullorum]MCB5410017.1 phage tail tape measure protein [Pseudogemmobacter faecipullorum]